MVDINLLRRLCEASGISGNENEVRNIILDEIRNLATNIEVDALGNIIAFKKGKKKPKQKLMICAHMDEVGFVVTDITDDGLLKFETVGGISNSAIVAKSVTVGKNKIRGVIGTKPIHLVKESERNEPIKASDMYIDIGATNKEDAEKYIRYCDEVCFNSAFKYGDGIVKSKALDDRIGCAILIELMKKELAFDIYFAFTTQEEIGLRGSKVCTYNIEPDSAIVVEATTAADVFNVGKTEQVCKLHGGAVVSFMDKRTIYDKSYFDLACRVAESEKINYQIKRAVAGGNDAGSIQVSKTGVKTLALSVPCRYIHTSMSIAAEDDINSVYKLVLKIAEKIAFMKEENE